MESFKALSQLAQPDDRHALIDAVSGSRFTLEGLHEGLSRLSLSPATPEEIRSQFNVARNLALYTWYSYSLDPVVQLKSFILIEHALRIRDGREKPSLSTLLTKAVKQRWITDVGFSHVSATPGDDQAYCKTLIKVLPELRNGAAHGSEDLQRDALQSLTICADFINQIFPAEGPR